MQRKEETIQSINKCIWKNINEITGSIVVEKNLSNIENTKWVIVPLGIFYNQILNTLYITTTIVIWSDVYLIRWC
jgi:hypothetical protein